MKQKFIYIACCIVILAIACDGQVTNNPAKQWATGTDGFPFVEKHDLDSGTAQGYVTLTVENPTIKTNERASIDVRFVNTGMGRDFFNPYFKPRIAPPGQIALYDGNHNYLCDLQSYYTGSVIGMSWDDFTGIPGGGSFIGFTMTVKPSYYRQPLQPGDYYVQIIYYKAFIALEPPWSETDPDVTAKRERLKDFEAHFDRSELFRSNPVKITITE